MLSLPLSLFLAACSSDDSHESQNEFLAKVRAAYVNDMQGLSLDEVQILKDEFIDPDKHQAVDLFYTALTDDVLDEIEKEKLSQLGISTQQLDQFDWHFAWIKKYYPKIIPPWYGFGSSYLERTNIINKLNTYDVEKLEYEHRYHIAEILETAVFQQFRLVPEQLVSSLELYAKLKVNRAPDPILLEILSAANHITDSTKEELANALPKAKETILSILEQTDNAHAQALIVRCASEGIDTACQKQAIKILSAADLLKMLESLEKPDCSVVSGESLDSESAQAILGGASSKLQIKLLEHLQTTPRKDLVSTIYEIALKQDSYELQLAAVKALKPLVFELSAHQLIVLYQNIDAQSFISGCYPEVSFLLALSDKEEAQLFLLSAINLINLNKTAIILKIYYDNFETISRQATWPKIKEKLFNIIAISTRKEYLERCVQILIKAGEQKSLLPLLIERIQDPVSDEAAVILFIKNFGTLYTDEAMMWLINAAPDYAEQQEVLTAINFELTRFGTRALEPVFATMGQGDFLFTQFFRLSPVVNRKKINTIIHAKFKTTQNTKQVLALLELSRQLATPNQSDYTAITVTIDHPLISSADIALRHGTFALLSTENLVLLLNKTDYVYLDELINFCAFELEASVLISILGNTDLHSAPKTQLIHRLQTKATESRWKTICSVSKITDTTIKLMLFNDSPQCVKNFLRQCVLNDGISILFRKQAFEQLGKQAQEEILAQLLSETYMSHATLCFLISLEDHSVTGRLMDSPQRELLLRKLYGRFDSSAENYYEESVQFIMQAPAADVLSRSQLIIASLKKEKLLKYSVYDAVFLEKAAALGKEENQPVAIALLKLCEENFNDKIPFQLALGTIYLHEYENMGMQAWDALQLAENYFDMVMDADKNNAQGYLGKGLAEHKLLLCYLSFLTGNEGEKIREKSRKNLLMALKLDPTLVEAHCALSSSVFYKTNFDDHYHATQCEKQRAKQTTPPAP